MASLKENIQIQTEGLNLAVSDLLYRFKTGISNLPTWQRYLGLILLIVVFVGGLGFRFGGEQVYSATYKTQSLLAHDSFSEPSNVSVESVKVLASGENRYSAYAVISNPNLDLSAEKINYEFKLYNTNRELIKTVTGNTFITPNEKKWVVESRIDTLDAVASAEFSVGQIDWQKKLDLPKVDLRFNQPFLNDQLNPPTLFTQGSVVNNSPFSIAKVSLVIVLYGQNNEVVAVAKRDEFNLVPYERRVYNLPWPDLNSNQITKVEVQGYTNTLDTQNLTSGSSSTGQSLSR
ncbi:MAG: hypothetical protein R3B41_01765 [Candidatus Doudnabacteria bacterium]